MDDIKKITEKIKKFRDERDWMKFHNHKDMALSLVLGAAEVLEHFQWKSPEEVMSYDVYLGTVLIFFLNNR
jgi:NTP pyrophosphatase (non-canonical NTP hydrolase)